VGAADNKNPKGQAPDGSDHNNGYECDGNHGIGRSNPAHTGCRTSAAVAGSTATQGTTIRAIDPASAPADPAVVTVVDPTVDSAAKPGCAGGTMTVDANGDGTIDDGDCTAVEGTALVRAASASGTSDPASAAGGSSPRTGGVEVLGATMSRGSALPLTGASTSVLVMVGLLLIGAGALLVAKVRAVRA
jgi:LPXTG-motif cell wall-anchored protein